MVNVNEKDHIFEFLFIILSKMEANKLFHASKGGGDVCKTKPR